MDSWVQDVEYVLMPSRSPVPGYEEEYFASYLVWRKAWLKFRGEVDIKDKLAADGFLVSHEIGALFYKGECVGLSAFTHGTLSRGPLPDHSWWNAWTPEAIEALRRISDNIIICSQFTVNPEFAGKNQIVRWKEIVSLVSQLRYIHSPADVMAGHLNLTRGMQNACGEENGATVLDPCRAFSFYGKQIEAQLVAYERKNLHAMIAKKELGPLADALWSKLVHLSDYPITRSADRKLRLVA